MFLNDIFISECTYYIKVALSQRRESLEQAGGPAGLTSVLAGN